MPDVFVSYSRRDGDFVGRLTDSLEERGKSVWIDTEGIADSEVFPDAIRSAIEESDGLIFVISPDSTTSRYCAEELRHATAMHKRIVPVLRELVADDDLPLEVRDRSWIPFTESDEYAGSLDRVVRALDTDLEARKEHTTWLVKAVEWDAKGRSRSLLLRGSELKAAEAWLARSTTNVDLAPTPLQNDYVLASRRGAARRQRTVAAVSLVVAAVAVVLGIVALVSRNQAVSARNTQLAQALAAESENELPADPVVSVLLARHAVSVDPIPQAVSALRQAMDASAVRKALPNAGGSCNNTNNGPSAMYLPGGRRIAVATCDGHLFVYDASTGHRLLALHLGSEVTALASDTSGNVLAAGTPAGVDLVDASDGSVTAQLHGTGVPNSLAFGQDDQLVAATTSWGTVVWDRATGAIRNAWKSPLGFVHTLAFTPDGHSLIVGTGGGFTAVYDLETGKLGRTLVPPGQQAWATTGGASPIALAGNLLVVGYQVSGPGRHSAEIDLWNTNTWTMTSVLTTMTGTQVADVAVTQHGSTVAVGNADGTGGVWSVSQDAEVQALEGQTAELNTVGFDPAGNTVITAANDGTVRIYRAGGPWAATVAVQVCSCGNEVAFSHGHVEALSRAGNDLSLQEWALPSGHPVGAGRILSGDQTSTGAALSPDGRLAALWDDTTTSATSGATSSVRVVETSTGRTVFTLPPLVVGGVTISDDDRVLVVQGLNGTVHVTTLADGRTVVGSGWPSRCSDYSYPAISPNDQYLALFTFCGEVALGNLRTARPPRSTQSAASCPRSPLIKPVNDWLSRRGMTSSPCSTPSMLGPCSRWSGTPAESTA